MNTLITTDLDRTLIFSRRAIARLGGALPASAVDDADGQQVGLADEVRETLHALAPLSYLVPVSARTPDRLARLQMPFHSRYKVASNGAVVLIDDIPDPAWRERVHIDREDVQTAVELLNRTADPSVLTRYFTPSDAFVCAITPTEPAAAELCAQLQDKCAGINWRSVATGRKVYLQPAGLDKAHAVEYVRARIIEECSANVLHLAAGDSVLDKKMLSIADLAWAPRNSELHKIARDPKIRMTAEPGHRAAREITAAWLAISRAEPDTR